MVEVFDRPHSGEVVTLGEAMALLLAESGSSLETTGAFDLGVAGAEATVAIGLSRLGHRARYVGRIGDDALGRRVVRELRGNGVDVSDLHSIDGAQTGLLVRDAPPDRPISVLYYRSGSAASTLRASDIPEDDVRAAALLHVTGITAMLSDSAQEAVLHAIETARAAGTPVSFDPNVRLKLADESRWRGLIETIAPLADIVLTGADEAGLVTDAEPSAWFHDRGATTVVVKDGANGAYESDGSSTTRQGVLRTTAVDTVGAGDAFAAGWIAAWLDGQPAQERLQQAAAVASLCVGVRGDLPGLPDRRTLERVLQSTEDVDR